jgi:hypothetical protein
LEWIVDYTVILVYNALLWWLSWGFVRSYSRKPQDPEPYELIQVCSRERVVAAWTMIILDIYTKDRSSSYQKKKIWRILP